MFYNEFFFFKPCISFVLVIFKNTTFLKRAVEGGEGGSEDWEGWR